MVHSTEYRELRNGKRYQTSLERKMSNHGSTVEIANRSSSENAEGEIPDFQTLTQEAVNEQLRGFIAPVTLQLEELTRLVQGMTTSRHPNSYPRTELGTSSGTSMPQSDTGYLDTFPTTFESFVSPTAQRSITLAFEYTQWGKQKSCKNCPPKRLSRRKLFVVPLHYLLLFYFRSVRIG